MERQLPGAANRVVGNKRFKKNQMDKNGLFSLQEISSSSNLSELGSSNVSFIIEADTKN